MKHRTIATTIAGVVAATALAGGAVAVASGGGDEGTVTGPGAERATAAALAEVGGTANAVERDSENGATWEVEVTKPDGTTVDVRLDADYQVVVIEGDSEAADTGDAG